MKNPLRDSAMKFAVAWGALSPKSSISSLALLTIMEPLQTRDSAMAGSGTRAEFVSLAEGLADGVGSASTT